MIEYRTERRLLQCAVFIAACVPVAAGAGGMMTGTALFDRGDDTALDSHFRYLSGLLCALGLNFWWMLPRIEEYTNIVRALTSLVVVGGIARLLAAILVATPSLPMQLALVMELVITPLLCLWQARIARLAH